MPTIKPLPRISGELNNCGVNAGIPELLAKFSEFAAGEVSNKQKQVIPQNFQQLKDSFETYYQLQNLTWKKLIALLTGSVNNNALAQQLILGPVLREFMHQKAPNKGYNTLDLSELNARYGHLDAEELNSYLYRPLGFKLTAHEYQPTSNDYLKITHDGASEQSREIHIYNDNRGHWERYSAAEMPQAVDGRITLLQDCPVMYDMYDKLSNGNTRAGLDKLKATVATLHDNVAAQASQQAQPAKEIEENILRIKTNEEKWIAVRDANEEKSRQERQKKNEDEKQSILENIRQAITVPPQSDPNKYLTDLNTAINLFYHYLILPGTPEDTQNKSLLRPYIAQVESDLTKMNPKYLPEVTELTYRILLSQISPEDTDNTQHAINLATRMRELKKWRYLGNFALIILCATLLASAVIVLLASVAHGGCGASGHYLASFLNFLSAKHWSITAAKITDVTPYVTAAVVTGSSLFGLFATHNLKENAASIINKKANSATAELFLNQPRSKPHDSKISDSEASDAKLSEPGDHKSH